MGIAHIDVQRNLHQSWNPGQHRIRPLFQLLGSNNSTKLHEKQIWRQLQLQVIDNSRAPDEEERNHEPADKELGKTTGPPKTMIAEATLATVQEP